MKTVKMYDTRGNEIEVNENQLARHYKKSLITLWSELGHDPVRLAAYDDDLYRIVGAMVTTIRDTRSRLELAEKTVEKARIEFRKLKDKQLDDFETMMGFFRRMLPPNVSPEELSEESPVQLRRVA